MSFTYFDPASIAFGVCRGPLTAGKGVLVPVDGTVQGLLQEMVQNTRSTLGLTDARALLEQYETSQEHGSESKLVLPLDNPLAQGLRSFYAEENRSVDASALREPQEITAYFCIIHDRNGNKLIGIRRAAQFKGVLKARLIQFIDDTLKAVQDDVFKLDTDFDLLIVEGSIYINRVTAFELLADIDAQVQAAAVENTRALETTLPFINFSGITAYVETHKRAARLVAALNARTDLAATSTKNLKQECKRSGVPMQTLDGQLSPEAGHELAFLQLLDRRRYALSLVTGKWEQYEAASRREAGVRIEEATRAAPAKRKRGARG